MNKGFIKDYIKNSLEIALNLIIPPVCISCGELLYYDSLDSFCTKCYAKWQAEKKRPCPICQKSHIICVCPLKYGEKRIKELKYYHLAEYTKEDCKARDIIIYCKDKPYKRLFELMASELYLLPVFKNIDRKNSIIAYVPRDAEKVRVTGLDQAKLVSKKLSRLSGIPLVNAIKRTRSKEQKELTARERAENASKAYKINEKMISSVAGKTAILYDDVVTTGATAIACAKVLMKMGAKEVIMLSIGRRYCN